MKDQDRLIDIIRNHFRGNGPVFGAEVGVWAGETSKALLTAFPSNTLYMIDAWDLALNDTMKRKDKNWRATFEAEKRARAIADDHYPMAAVKKGLSVEVAQSFNFKLCFAFLDAGHSEKDVTDDLIAWYSHVREGGLIIIHDYNGLLDRRGKWGVKIAVDAYCDEHHIPLKSATRFAWFVVGEFEDGEPE